MKNSVTGNGKSWDGSQYCKWPSFLPKNNKRFLIFEMMYTANAGATIQRFWMKPSNLQKNPGMEKMQFRLNRQILSFASFYGN